MRPKPAAHSTCPGAPPGPSARTHAACPVSWSALTSPAHCPLVPVPPRFVPSPADRNRDELTGGRVAGHALVVLPAPQEPLSPGELAALNMHIERGGSVLCLAAEGGDAKLGSNLNALTEP